MKNMHRPPFDDEGELVSEATHKKYLSVQTEGKIVIKNIHRSPCAFKSQELIEAVTIRNFRIVQKERKIAIKMIQRPPYTSCQGILDYCKKRNKKIFAIENDFDKAIKLIEKKKKEKP